MRRWLLGGAAILLMFCGLGVAAVTAMYGRLAVDTIGEVEFTRALAVPPLAESTVDSSGTRVFDLRAAPGRTTFGVDGVDGATPTAGYNGSYLGPTLRATRGETVRVNVRNELRATTTLHWHGMHLPAQMDGGPHQGIRRGTTWSPSWTVNQPAATLWYHPHPHGDTENQVYQGLAGMFILDDPGTGGMDLPKRYGIDDVPVIVQDRGFASDGQFDIGHRFGSDVGVLGDTLLVNGTFGPYLDVRTERIRLRLLNGSTARVYNFGLSDDRPFELIGTDGGLLPTPFAMHRIQLSPGERAELVLTMRAGERVNLRSYRPDVGPIVARRFNGGADQFDVLQLRAAPSLQPSPQVPRRLVDLPRLDPAAAEQRRELTFNARVINGRSMRMNRVDMTIVKDTVEVWTVRNNHETPHSMHIHDVQFQVLDVEGAPPPPQWSGWKDTLQLPTQQDIRIIARFADYADPTAAYMFHCHVLLHEDEGMMGQFVVVERGQRAALRTTHGP